MSFQELVKKVESSNEFCKFKKENKKAILYSGFFTIRQAFGNLILESEQLDYWLGQDDVATFFIEENKIKNKIDKLEKKDKKFNELDRKIKIDVEDIEKIILKELEKENLEIKDVSKIIIILQKPEKQIWNITCIIGLQMLRMHIDIHGKILEKKKGSLFDMMKIEEGKKNK
jgi:frataxin-like iron-binding protein CyaY